VKTRKLENFKSKRGQQLPQSLYTAQKCEAVLKRARIQGSWIFVSLNSRLESNKEEEEKGGERLLTEKLRTKHGQTSAHRRKTLASLWQGPSCDAAATISYNKAFNQKKCWQ
jgi:hypothetical protein